MFKKFIFFFILFLFSSNLPSFSLTFEVSDFSDLKNAINGASKTENNIITIESDIIFDSSLTLNSDFEFLGKNKEKFDLNGYNLTFQDANKTSKISNLNVIEKGRNSAIVARDKLLVIEKSNFSSDLTFGNELIRKTAGDLEIKESSFSDNYSYNGAGIYFSGSNFNLDNSKFLNNKASLGGAIFLNSGKSAISNSNFEENSSSAEGGAIYVNKNAILNLDNVTFLNNSVTTASTGGAISNKGELTIKNGSIFKGNEVLSGSAGAISNAGILEIENTIFDSNIAKQDGGAISSSNSLKIKNSSFLNNKSSAYNGGAIVAFKDLNIDNTIFENNSSYEAGGAISAMQASATISNSSFLNNSSETSYGGGAILNYLSNMDIISSKFQNNSSKTDGGAIMGTIRSTTNILNGASFINNSSSGLGGAIFSEGKINIIQDDPNKDVIFSGNKDSTGSNAIHLGIFQNSQDVGSLNVEVSNGAKVVFEDNLSGLLGTKANFKGNSSFEDKIYLGSNNENFKSTLDLDNISLEFYNQNSSLSNAKINAKSSHFNFMNGVVSSNKLNLNLLDNNNHFSIDVDAKNIKSDYFEFDPSSNLSNNILIRDINLLSEPTDPLTIFDIFDHDTFGTNLALSEDLKNRTVYGAIKKYAWSLTPKLTLTRLEDFNPNIQRYQAATASAFMNQMLSYDYSLNRTDEIYTNLREIEISQRKQNSYAYLGRGGIYLDQYDEDGSSFWIRPYVNLESFHLSGAYSTIGNQSFGTMMGFDFPSYLTESDWEIFSTIYGAYIGSSQEFSDSNISQNGGYIGYLLSAYKDDFYLGWTINGGGLGVHSNYLYNNDNYAIVSAGSALKLAYNLKFKHFIIQPNFTTAYTFLSPMDLVNFQSVDINQTQVNGLTISPSIRLTFRNEAKLEPYIFAGCVIPIMSDIKASANSINLEKMTLNPWAQFGAGIKKRISDRIDCFLETVIRTGGRVGWGLMFNIQISI